ncbi:MAG: sigma 54-interacting transcriptional regulator [Aureliella sp.]
MQQTTPQAYLILQSDHRWTEVIRLANSQSVIIGRASDSGIVVKEEGVSRQHAKVSPQSGGWQVEDLGSRNGTLVSGKRIEEPQLLSEGDRLQVGSCLLLFTYSLQGTTTPPLPGSGQSQQATADLGNPTIVDRRSNSRWSNPAITPSEDLSSQVGVELTPPANQMGAWSFFYRLIFDLVGCQTRDQAAKVALESVLGQLKVGSGGVVAIQSGAAEAMSVLATHQPAGGSYRRLSDFLIESILTDKQALLARNVMGDSKLSFSSQSAQRETVSVICAPVFADVNERKEVVAILHIYTAGDQRMLTEGDLELVIGVADNLSIALAQQTQRDSLAESLESSRREVDELRRQLGIESEMVGSSEGLEKVKQAIARAAPTPATVLVRGESGVGKELVARAIHVASPRSSGPLVCLNCAALAPTLLESELFGHEKGAFTGATERKTGKFEAANGGTLFLDEIGEMPLDLQAKFLRALEGQPFERLGGHKPIKTDVRVIAATNRDLEGAVNEKEFRSDLYFRLRVVEIEVPPLRARQSDLPALVQHFIQQLALHAGGRKIEGIAPEALEALSKHDWPGNIRELRNVMERAIVLGSGSTIGVDDLSLSTIGLSAQAQSSEGPSAEPAEFQPISLARLERQHIFATLEHVENNKTQASRLLGIERSTLDRKLKRFAVDDSK